MAGVGSEAVEKENEMNVKDSEEQEVEAYLLSLSGRARILLELLG